VVIVLINALRRLVESGTQKLRTCLHKPATVYMDIPAGGEGQIRTLVSGVMTVVDARAAGADALPAGTPVRVTKLLDSETVEVAPRDKANQVAEPSD